MSLDKENKIKELERHLADAIKARRSIKHLLLENKLYISKLRIELEDLK